MALAELETYPISSCDIFLKEVKKRDPEFYPELKAIIEMMKNDKLDDEEIFSLLFDTKIHLSYENK